MPSTARKFEGPADFYRRMRVEFNLSPLESAVFSLCHQAAEEGRELESNDDMMEILNELGFALGAYGGGTIPGIMKRLEEKGAISRQLYQRGRSVCVPATGKCTVPPPCTAPHWRLRTDQVQAPAIQQVRQKMPQLSTLIEQEARRLGKHMTDFLADLVYIGWHEYAAEQEREQA